MKSCFTLLLCIVIYCLSYAQNDLTNLSDLNLTIIWEQEPQGWEYETFIHVPSSEPPATGFPVCIALHGNGGNGQGMLNTIKNLLECHIIIAPSGYANSWNICSEQSDAPDVEVITQLVESLSMFTNIDQKKIKLLGSSNGAALTNRLFIENPNENISQFVAIVSQLTSNQIRDNIFYGPQAETSNQLEFCGYDKTYEVAQGRKYLSVCNINDPVIPYSGGTSVGTSFIDAENSIYTIALSQGFIGSQITEGILQENSDNSLFSYLDDQVMLLNGTAGHTTNAEQRAFIASFMDDCVIPSSTFEIEKADLCKIFPNPTSDIIRISNTKTMELDAKLYNALGQLLQTQVSNLPVLQFDLSTYKSGLYFLRLNTNETKTVIRL